MDFARCSWLIFLLAMSAGCRHDGKDSMEIDVDQYNDAMESIVVAHGKETGTFDLADNLASLSHDGKVIVTQLGETTRGFLFVRWRGKGANFDGVLCLSQPDKTLIFKDAYGASAISLTVPCPGTDAMDTCDVDAQIEATNAPGVYHVSHRLD